MTNKELIIPFYAKATIFLVGLFALITLLYIAKSIMIPIVFAIIIAILLNPVVNLFIRIKINRLIAIVLTLLLTFIVFASIGILLSSQATMLGESWPMLIENFTKILNQTITWFSGHFNLNPQKVHEWISNTKGEIINTSGAAIGRTLLTVGGVVAVLFLVPVYTFMMLYYKPLLLNFVRKLFGTDNQSQVNEVVAQTKTLVQHYIIGLLAEAVIIAVLYTTGLLIIGIDYAILLAFIAAILNVIPYLGGPIALSIILVITIATKDSAKYPLMVIALSSFIHVVDNSFIIPKIVASKVKINALFCIISVIAGSALWGVPGMFLSIPILAIIKLIFDHIEPLKPWGFLLGDTMPPIIKIEAIIKKIKIKSKSK